MMTRMAWAMILMHLQTLAGRHATSDPAVIGMMLAFSKAIAMVTTA
jgi:hypothetical protein